MKQNKVQEIKEHITVCLQTSLDDDTIRTTDVFKYGSGHSFQLTHFGFRNLAKSYEFMELDAKCDVNVQNYSYIDRTIKGLYYVASSKSKDGLINIHTTDKRFVKRMKLFNNDLNSFISEVLKKQKRSV